MQPTMDLNLLVALDVLLEEGSVTGAARRLHLSVPATSRTLGRIRAALSDPVLVRSGRGLVPTPRALALQGKVRALVEQARAVLVEGAEVEPATMTRSFSLQVNDSMIGVLGGKLVERAAAEAPNVTLRFLAEGIEDSTALQDGAIDLEVGVLGPTGPAVRVEQLYSEHVVGVARAGHPLTKGRVSAERFAEASHLLVTRRGRTSGPIDALLAERGLRRRVAVTVPTYAAAAHMLAGTDAVATFPSGFATAVADRLGLRVFDVPLPLEPLPMSMAWHRRYDADAAHGWLRERVREVVVG
ncbi:LysR family transcriptional regulator [Allokutzneria oryzae]|uniref:LysR family transcriptional regulator n=1 Tax=Allokutzneria oryzae TaxID=1378989 RepID=A0ABV5ZTM6_9PSEU